MTIALLLHKSYEVKVSTNRGLGFFKIPKIFPRGLWMAPWRVLTKNGRQRPNLDLSLLWKLSLVHLHQLLILMIYSNCDFTLKSGGISDFYSPKKYTSLIDY